MYITSNMIPHLLEKVNDIRIIDSIEIFGRIYHDYRHFADSNNKANFDHICVFRSINGHSLFSIDIL